VNARDLDPAQDYIFTIGHSNASFEALLENLRAYEIEAVVDVRSQPVSKYTPHFNRGELSSRLQEAGIKYTFMGDALGGRPADPSLYDEDGYVRYDLWSATGLFRDGIESLLAIVRGRRGALLCAEEDPARCHRHLLIARVLRADGVDGGRIRHIRRDGACRSDLELASQAELFDDAWRSPAPLADKIGRRASAAR
jgi:uncharacterized protein (DUF488 family)